MPEVVLLDTTVASLFHPKRGASSVKALYEPLLRGKTLALSFHSVAELWEWAEKNHWGDRNRDDLDSHIRRFLIIPYTYALAKVWARIMAKSRASGRRFEAGDCWIAATAVHMKLTLLTHDADFTDREIEGLDVICRVATKS